MSFYIRDLGGWYWYYYCWWWLLSLWWWSWWLVAGVGPVPAPGTGPHRSLRWCGRCGGEHMCRVSLRRVVRRVRVREGLVYILSNNTIWCLLSNPA